MNILLHPSAACGLRSSDRQVHFATHVPPAPPCLSSGMKAKGSSTMPTFAP